MQPKSDPQVSLEDQQNITEYLLNLGLFDDTLFAPQRPFQSIQGGKKTNSDANKIRRHNLSGLKASRRMVDELPTKPNKSDPRPRLIEPFRKLSKKCTLVFFSSGDRYEYKIQREIGTLNDEQLITAAVTHDTLERRRPIFRYPLTLLMFQPVVSPFVPDLLCLLINCIETYCLDNSWDYMFESLEQYSEEGVQALVQLVKHYWDTKKLKKLIRELSQPVRILAVRLFLQELNMKPLHFQRQQIHSLAQSPLFDFFLRPNPGFQDIVKHTALSSPVVQVDTMAFMMLHLMHAMEFTDQNSTGRLKLASLYGPLLISFAEKPILYGSVYNDGKSIECCMMEVLLDTCDQHFWNHLTGLKILPAFDRNKQRKLNPKGEVEFTISSSDHKKLGPIECDDILDLLEINDPKNLCSVYRRREPSVVSSEMVETSKDIQSLYSMMVSEKTAENRSRQKFAENLSRLSYISPPAPYMSLAEVGAPTFGRTNQTKAEERFVRLGTTRQHTCRTINDIFRSIGLYRSKGLINRNVSGPPYQSWFRANSVRSRKSEQCRQSTADPYQLCNLISRTDAKK